jgi:hypothetical protein
MATPRGRAMIAPANRAPTCRRTWQEHGTDPGCQATLGERVRRDPAFASALLDAPAARFRNGEPHTARRMRRDLVNATPASRTDMLSPEGSGR